MHGWVDGYKTGDMHAGARMHASMVMLHVKMHHHHRMRLYTHACMRTHLGSEDELPRSGSPAEVL